jgi:hypothetical protein
MIEFGPCVSLTHEEVLREYPLVPTSIFLGLESSNW